MKEIVKSESHQLKEVKLESLSPVKESKSANIKDFFDKKKSQKKEVIQQQVNNDITDHIKPKEQLQVDNNVEFKQYIKSTKDYQINEELQNSHKMLLELSKIQNIAEEIKQSETTNDDSIELEIESTNEQKDEINNNVELKSDEKIESKQEQISQFSDEAIYDLKNELISNLTKEIFDKAFKIVYDKTPNEFFYYNKEVIIDEINRTNDLDKANKEKIIMKIPELFALVFDHKQREFLMTFKSLQIKK